MDGGAARCPGSVPQTPKAGPKAVRLEDVKLLYLKSFIPSLLDRIKRDKGVWWMPWQQEAMKDVITCDKRWGAGNRL